MKEEFAMRIALVDDCLDDLSIMHQFLAEALDTDSVITEFHNGEDFFTALECRYFRSDRS